MKILGLTHSWSGVGYHRVMLPVSLMPKEKGRITDTLNDELLQQGWDIVLYNRTWDAHDLIALREKYGFKIVIDIDDYWVLDHFHLLYDAYAKGGEAFKIVNGLKNADLVTTTHELLAEKVREYNPNVVIVPNSLPYGEFQFNDSHEPSEKLRYFWAGGITHENDLKILREPISKMEGVKFVMGGYSDNNQTEMLIWGKMGNYFTDNQRQDHLLIRALPPYDYYQMYRHADVVLIPLKKSTFNQYKSNLKILEAAGKGLPVICSAVHPYLGFPEDLVNYASDTKTWLHWMNKLKYSEELRCEQGKALRSYVDKHYNFTDINKKRAEAFKSLLKLA